MYFQRFLRGDRGFCRIIFNLKCSWLWEIKLQEKYGLEHQGVLRCTAKRLKTDILESYQCCIYQTSLNNQPSKENEWAQYANKISRQSPGPLPSISMP